MSNHTAHTTQTTSVGLSGTSLNDNKAANKTYLETLGEFEIRVAGTAKGEWLETTPEVLRAVFPRGLGTNNGEPVQHACYKGVLVCEHGKMEEIIRKMDEPINNRLHGSKEAVVISGR